MFGRKRKQQEKQKSKITNHVYEYMMHNVLQIIERGDCDHAYLELCYVMQKAGIKMNEHETERYVNLVDILDCGIR